VTSTKVVAYVTALQVGLPDRLRNPEEKTAYRREQLAAVRAIALDPPEPPFALILTIGGRTHQLYRGVVCHSRDECVLTLEGERIYYSPAALADRIDLCKQLIAATGKPRLAESPAAVMVCTLQEHYGGAAAELLDRWEPVWSAALTRLALFLSPVKEDCAREYPRIENADASHVRRGHRASR
jgi:hypothetical protein